MLANFNIRYTLLSSHIGQGWNLFPLFKGYLQVRTNLNHSLSIHVLEYIIANNLSYVQSIDISKGTINRFVPYISHICFSSFRFSILKHMTRIVESHIIYLHKMSFIDNIIIKCNYSTFIVHLQNKHTK